MKKKSIYISHLSVKPKIVSDLCIRDQFTKAFMKMINDPDTEKQFRKRSSEWWVNNRRKRSGGLRLSEAGYQFLLSQNYKTYKVLFPPELDLKPQVILYLDKFIECPYYFDSTFIIVLYARIAFDLHLFSGDVQKYGLTKAMTRKKYNPPEV